jgi:sulfite reductase beta subunit-like hemoprotein
VRELRGGAHRLADALGLESLDCRADAGGVGGSRRSTRRLGAQIQHDGLFAISALPPLARLAGAQLERLAERSRALNAGVRVSPWRTLSFVDIPACAVAGLLEELQGLGLVVCDASGWTGLSACAGLRACARARVDVRAAAAARALVREASSPTEHWSGCERRCGEPADVGIRFIASGAPGLAEHALARRALAERAVAEGAVAEGGEALA